ncbi:MAG: imidazole glycerol phosphate synthase subunit HisH [Bdellovibrio sp.]|nr:imidazole glycerol phosphate synthase subunit HisH [Bdellovibrio sp.]
MTKKIAIIDYGLGNIFSIKQALLRCDAEVVVTDSHEVIKAADGLLLPGVGAFTDAMLRLNRSGLAQLIQEEVQNKKPLLGVCLGLQLLFDRSFEFGESKGLGLIPGDVIQFPTSYESHSLRVPFIGWNTVNRTDSQTSNKLLEGISEKEKFYFVHSYHAKPADENCVVAYCDYLSYVYPAIIQVGHIVGVQGHPEKSSEAGLRFYKNWIDSIK